MESPWVLPYNRTSKSRINGLGANGFSFINTDNPQAETGSGYMGAAVLALDTTGAQNIRVTWTGGTVTPNTCDYGIRLQYRVGESAALSGCARQWQSGGIPAECHRRALVAHRPGDPAVRRRQPAAGPTPVEILLPQRRPARGRSSGLMTSRSAPAIPRLTA